MVYSFKRLTDTFISYVYQLYRDDSGIPKGNFEEGHAFIGYQKNTPAVVVFQASKQLERFRKGLSMSRLSESGIFGDVPIKELLNEAKDSDMWKDAVSHITSVQQYYYYYFCFHTFTSRC